MKEYFEDDRIIIPDDIKQMPKEQLEKEIARLEEEARENKAKKQKLAATV